MSKRIEQAQRRGPFDPRAGRVFVLTPRGTVPIAATKAIAAGHATKTGGAA